MKIGIFTTPMPHVVENAVKSCQSIGVDYEIVDIFSANWIENVKAAGDCDGFFCPSNCISQELKTIQDERYYFVSQVMHRPIYPDFTGLYIHESKRNMAAWLEINGYPHARTRVFTKRKEALEYLDKCEYPIVTKANVGAGASKVVILKNKNQAVRMAKRCLPEKYSSLRPGWSYRLSYKRWYAPVLWDVRNLQSWYFIAQDYVPNVLHEWRILRIGDYYFGHQKLMKGQFASGSGLVGWVAPPVKLLDMVRELTDRGGFRCMDVDIFETKEGTFYINELQSFFGSYLDYQMSIDGEHGRYYFNNGKYEFQSGDFNVFGSTRLKIEDFVSLLKK